MIFDTFDQIKSPVLVLNFWNALCDAEGLPNHHFNRKALDATETLTLADGSSFTVEDAVHLQSLWRKTPPPVMKMLVGFIRESQP